MKVISLLLLTLIANESTFAEKIVIQPEELLTRGGAAFNEAVLVDGTLYISTQVGRDLKTKKVPEEFEAEVRQVLENIGVILRAAKMDYKDVVSVQVYLTDMSLFSRMNAVYTAYFKSDRPARTTVGVSFLPVTLEAGGPARIEISAIAHR